MADAVTSQARETGLGQIIHLTNLCDTTGESGVVKVDKSAAIFPDGTAVGKLAIEKVQYSVQGFTYVKIAFDHTTDDTALILAPGSTVLDFTELGGVVDPDSAGGTGDIVLTTVGNSAGDTYDITLHVRYYN